MIIFMCLLFLCICIVLCLEYDCELIFLYVGKGEIVSEYYSFLFCDLRDLKILDDVFIKV